MIQDDSYIAHIKERKLIDVRIRNRISRDASLNLLNHHMRSRSAN